MLNPQEFVERKKAILYLGKCIIEFVRDESLYDCAKNSDVVRELGELTGIEDPLYRLGEAYIALREGGAVDESWLEATAEEGCAANILQERIAGSLAHLILLKALRLSGCDDQADLVYRVQTAINDVQGHRLEPYVLHEVELLACQHHNLRMLAYCAEVSRQRRLDNQEFEKPYEEPSDSPQA